MSQPNLLQRVFLGQVPFIARAAMLVGTLLVCGRSQQAAMSAEPVRPPSTQPQAAGPQTMPSGGRSGNTPATAPSTREARLPVADRAKVAAARAELSGLTVALSVYEIDTGVFPTTDHELAALVQNPGVDNWHGPYMNKVPLDPWGHPYIYRSPGANGRAFDLLSAGPDGQEGSGDDIKSLDVP